MANIKKGGRLSNVEKDYKQSHAKELFIHGFALTNISEIIGIGVKTLAQWRDDLDWEREKELHNIRPSEIKKMILSYIQDLKDGKKSNYTPDQLSKIASAFDKLNDSRKFTVHAMESFDGFCQYLMREAAKQANKKRDDLINIIKLVRPFMDKYINELAKDD